MENKIKLGYYRDPRDGEIVKIGKSKGEYYVKCLKAGRDIRGNRSSWDDIKEGTQQSISTFGGQCFTTAGLAKQAAIKAFRLAYVPCPKLKALLYL